MTAGRFDDWGALDQQIATLFTPDCDPYGAGAAVLFDKEQDAVTQDDRDLTKRVFMCIAARRGMGAGGKIEQALRRSADALHEIGSAIATEGLIADCRNAILADKLHEKLRSRDQIKKIVADGFELCVRALADLGAKDVTIHECDARDMEHW